MLTEAILKMYADTRQERTYFGISSLSPCQMENYLNYMNHLQKVNKTKEVETEEIEPQQLLLMDDGNYGEAQIVDLLRRSGIETTHTGKDQATVHIGKAKIPGHPDGFIHGSQTHLLEVKLRQRGNYQKFVEGGLKDFQRIKTQVQLYLSAEDSPYPGIESARVIFKHKESVSLKDHEEVADPEFAGKITEETDQVIQGGFVPEPVLTDLCVGCRWASNCWGGGVVNFSGFQYLSLPEVSEKWIRGDYHATLGKMLKDEAEAELLTKMDPTKEELNTDRVKVTRKTTDTRKFNKKLFLKDHTEREWFDYTVAGTKTTVKIREI